MSHRFFEDDVLFFQRLLAGADMYGGELDGDWGPKTEAASIAWDAAYASARSTFGELDGRTEGEVRTLLPAAQRLARTLLRALAAAGLNAKIISGTRTYADQDGIWRQGRFGNPGDRVTNARGGQSNHNFGIAWDVGLFLDGRYLPDSPLYDRAGEVAAGVAGVEWGGDWRSFKDRPHYQAATGLSLAEVRRRFEAGQTFLK